MTAIAKQTSLVKLEPTSKTLTPAAVASSTAWLSQWTPAERLPEGVERQLPALIAAAEVCVAPADMQAFAVAMDGLIGWAERFGVIPMETSPDRRRRQIADIVAGYRDTLADLPADLLEAAVRRTTAAHKYRTLPLPGDIRAHAEDELRERADRLRRLRTAAMKAEMEAKARAAEPSDAPRDRTPEELAAAAEMAAQVKRALAEAKPMAVPKEPEDLKPETLDHRERMRRVREETAARRPIPKPWDRPAQHMDAAE